MSSYLTGSLPFPRAGKARRGADGSQRAVQRLLQPCCFAPYTAASILNRPLQASSEHRAFVPLLDPRKHSVPFGVALELYAAGGDTCHHHQRRRQQQQQHRGGAAVAGLAGAELLELRYVLAGKGKLVHSDGSEEVLEAGSSVLAPYGSAVCMADPAAGPLPAPSCAQPPCRASAAADLVGCLDLAPGEYPWSMASLVVYLHRNLLDQQQGITGHKQAAVHPLLLDLLSLEWGTSAAVPSWAAQTAAVDAAAAAGASRNGWSALLTWQHLQHGAELLSALAPWLAPHQKIRGAGATGSAAAAGRDAGGEPEGGTGCVIKRALQHLPVFQLPNQTNRLAVAFDPVATPQAPLVFGVEVFERNHRTTPHIHKIGHEIFFVIAGEGVAFCEGERMPLRPGDLIAFSPGAEHGIDVAPHARMYCLELMLPNDEFSEVVRSGREMGGLEAEDWGVMTPDATDAGGGPAA